MSCTDWDRRLNVTVRVLNNSACDCILPDVNVTDNMLGVGNTTACEGTVSVVLETVEVIELPAFTICTHVSNVINWEYLRHRYPNDTKLANITDTVEHNWQYWEYLMNLTLEEQLLNGTIDANRFFKACKVLQPRALSLSVQYVNCPLVAPVVESISETVKCFTMFSQNVKMSDNDQYRVDHDVMFRDNSFSLAEFRMDVKYLQGLTIYMHDRREPFVGPIGGQTTAMKLNHQYYYEIDISYKEVHVEQLPPPYRTQCANYPLLGYRSHKQRVGQCRADYYRDHFGGWQPDMFYNNEYYEYGKLSFERTRKTSNRAVDKQIAADCANEIGRRPDCHAVYYTMNKINDIERDNNGKDIDSQFFIQINMPTNTITRYVHSPRMELSQYMGIIGGVSGLWFGRRIPSYYDMGHNKTIVSVVLETAEVIELPAFTICTNVTNMIDVDYLRHRYPNDTALANITDTNENKWQYNQYLNNLTLEEQLLNGTIGADLFIKSCEVLLPQALSSSDQHIDCARVAPVVKSISEYLKCFTMFSQNVDQLAVNDQYRVNHDVMFRDNGFHLARFGLNVKYLQGLTIYMHDRREPFVGSIGGQNSYMDMNYQDYFRIDISYKEITVEQLPPHCVHYPIDKFRSHKHRVSHCRAEYYRDQLSGWQPDMLYNSDYNGKLRFEKNGMTINRTVDEQIAAHCAHRIGRIPDCYSVYYTINKIFNRKRDDNKKDQFYIHIAMPTNTITRYVHSPRMVLPQYMGIIGGVSWLWFGLRVPSFYDMGQPDTPPIMPIYSDNSIRGECTYRVTVSVGIIIYKLN
ncbi:unnamed protein product [Medioppia subpectinata]|uniref:Uncharacterized protein n=1 Tax=Medioppia subpectinata TaxID=1979941 RepID=A0A7R9KK01_9ACAR|nr:unnamed protein product [Medioppia subpectinata]CAG2104716.1 unnamed protein product [Medioppia subpectinata]